MRSQPLRCCITIPRPLQDATLTTAYHLPHAISELSYQLPCGGDDVLRRYEIKNKVFEFVKNEALAASTENTFTIIIGKNGTGKSRLLRSLVKKVVTDDIDYNLKHEVSSMFEGDLFLDRPPSKVICVSTSPFDFPILNYRQNSRAYSYLGVRGLAGRNCARQ